MTLCKAIIQLWYNIAAGHFYFDFTCNGKFSKEPFFLPCSVMQESFFLPPIPNILTISFPQRLLLKKRGNFGFKKIEHVGLRPLGLTSDLYLDKKHSFLFLHFFLKSTVFFHMSIWGRWNIRKWEELSGEKQTNWKWFEEPFSCHI